MSIDTWNKFKDLPASEKVYLAEITAVLASNPATTKTLYLATYPKGFMNYYRPVIGPGGVPRLKRSLQETFYGRSMPSWGKLVCLREDNLKMTADGSVEVDDLIAGTYLVRGQDAALLYGGEDLPYSEYQTIMTGKARRVTDWNNTEYSIEIIDLQEVLAETIVTPNVIAAAANVPTDSVGKTIPVALGACKNVTPILIHDANWIYRVHDDGVCDCNSITAVYDDGLAFAAGFVDNADGTFTLGGAPAGKITCDIQGGKFGAPAAYKVQIADIAEGLLEDVAGFSSGDIDSTYITNCNTDIPYTVGLYVDGKSDLLSVLDELIGGIPMWYTFTRAGVFRIGEFKAPTGSQDYDINTKKIVRGSVKGSAERELIWRQIIRYDRNYTVMEEDRTAAGVSLANKAWFANEWRESEANDSAIQTKFPLSTERGPAETCLTALADAAAVAQKWIDLLGTDRRKYELDVKPLTLDFEMHNLVDLTYPRFGLASGELFRIIEIQENHGQNLVNIKLWG